MRIDSILRPQRRRLAAAVFAGTLAGPALCQEIEPRIYSNAPIGMNFLIGALIHSEGGVSFDPAVPLTNARIKTDSMALAYARVFELAGQSAKVDVILPYATLDGTADFSGQPIYREVSGYADPRVRISANLIGAPALTLKEFAAYRPDLIVGASLQATLPTGQYDPAKAVNIGTNRWSLKPEVGAAKTLGAWTFELIGSATVFGDNDDFFGGKKREQDPIYALQGHVIHSLSNGIWAAFSATAFRGGQTTLDGVRKDDALDNSRYGLTAAFPIDRHHSVKISANSGVYTRTGTDFKTVGIAWQYRWGAGL